MGAWSQGNFGNDIASDWVWELEKSKGLDFLLSPILAVLNNSEYVEADTCCEALAASEVIAASFTRDYSLIPEEARDWLNRKQGWLFGSTPKITSEHAKLALDAVRKISSDSELLELWEESSEDGEWKGVQNALIAKLDIASESS
ncbi:DUF4259 domain-containing protein [Vibrio sp. SCSIO 43136]|uniref:DUF4259 domain-containing protein n=1 Tax=Vibrio sp. SCSIO 43136 TaxID=2819101 RepID=UPI002075D53D|nr:DUF4259 domain-containing protein [Vibrio sp. SCSIO 43136]USD66406.1 DUF4259 domain-containing protein [Vibrio sp. SCSIO 43136]